MVEESPPFAEQRFPSVKRIGKNHRSGLQAHSKRTILSWILQDARKDASKKLHEKYEILEEIGKGAYGTVYRAQNRLTGQTCAVKSILNAKLSNEEVETLKLLPPHPHVRTMLDFFPGVKTSYLVSDFANGGELFERIVNRGHLSETEAASLIKQVLSAADHCHKHGVIHRDIKPENLLFRTNRKDRSSPTDWRDLVLVDFGFAKRLVGEQRLHEVTGTPYYIAPEVLEEDYTTKSDIWSVGAVLFQMLSGFPPYLGKDNKDVMHNILNDNGMSFEYPEWEFVSPLGKAFVQKLLTRDPAKRIDAETALQDEWFHRPDLFVEESSDFKPEKIQLMDEPNVEGEEESERPDITAAEDQNSDDRKFDKGKDDYGVSPLRPGKRKTIGRELSSPLYLDGLRKSIKKKD
eukprot:g1452.t1